MLDSCPPPWSGLKSTIRRPVVGGHRLPLGSQSQWNFSKRLRLRIPFSQTTGLICNDDRQKPSHRTSGFASASKRHWTQKVRRRKGVVSTSSGRLSPISPRRWRGKVAAA